jgi:HAD superfamily hydrolase (TIGR01549 family)
MELSGSQGSLEEFTRLLSARARAYTSWARETATELDEVRLWTQWMLPDQPAGRIGELAVELNQLWREATGQRIVFPETKEVALELFRRGYRLGLVSNTTSSVEVPLLLEQLEISGCFEVVLLSCNTGTRKPEPAILLEAAGRMNVPAEKCAYVGDRLDRDVVGARKAGFGTAILIADEASLREQQAAEPGLSPDHRIENLRELLEIFPRRAEKPSAALVYDASCSTMWAKRNFTGLPDFMEAARRLGFARVEPNHQINTAMLSELKLDEQPFSSVHEPCPADVSTDLLKERDWLMSSPDEERRRHGVEAIKHSVELAARIGVDVIVVHCGMVSPDLTIEKKLRRLLEAGRAGGDEYRAIQQHMIEKRAALIGPCFEAVQRSLQELLDYARPFKIRLGLENRYHYFDIPTPDEMGELLKMAGPDQLGYVYDAGHAQALDRLGFFKHEDWLRRYASRIIETHLHDVRGVNDHLAPGLGEVDFDMIATYLPPNAIRTLELLSTNSPEQVQAGLRYLLEHGCIHTL